MLLNVIWRWSWCSSYLVLLCGFYYGAFHVESCPALCSCGLSVLLGIAITSLGEDRAGLYASRAILWHSLDFSINLLNLVVLSHVSSVMFSIVITSLWEGIAGLYDSCAFICLSCMR